MIISTKEDKIIMVSALQREQYFAKGYLIVKNVISEGQIEHFKAGIQKILDRAKSGEGPCIAWINKEKGIPARLYDLFSPDFFQPEVGDTLEQTKIIDIAEGIFEKSVRFSLCGMFTGGDRKVYVQNWHRDILSLSDPYPVTDLLRRVKNVVQINAPLFADQYFTLVPGSHLRGLTVAEKEAIKKDPDGKVPGEMIVELSPGDVVFYNADLLHRGYNPEGINRLTFNYVLWTADSPYFPLGEKDQLQWLNENTPMELYGPRVRTLLEGFLKVVGKDYSAKSDEENEKWELYQDETGEWRWRVKDLNGQIVKYSNLSYSGREDCLFDAKRCGYKEA